MNHKTKVHLVSKKIKTQFPIESPEGRLMYAVVEKALQDSILEDCHGKGARTYLNGPIMHAQLCDVDPCWIRSVISAVGLCIKIPRF